MTNTNNAEYKIKKEWAEDSSLFGLVPVSSLKAEKFEKFLATGRKRIWNDEDDFDPDRADFFWWLRKEGV
jgi:hypothetical protein